MRKSKKLLFLLIAILLFAACHASASESMDTRLAISSVDYSRDENWAYLGVGEKNTDLFLIAPTVYGSGTVFNMPVDDAAQRSRFVGALNMERGIYEDSCRMFAPPPVLALFGKGVYHIYDYQFFYRNLQKNVALRTAAYISVEK